MPVVVGIAGNIVRMTQPFVREVHLHVIALRAVVSSVWMMMIVMTTSLVPMTLATPRMTVSMQIIVVLKSVIIQLLVHVLIAPLMGTVLKARSVIIIPVKRPSYATRLVSQSQVRYVINLTLVDRIAVN